MTFNTPTRLANHPGEQAWHMTPEAIALFDKAWAICGHDDSAYFPYDIEADLNDLCNRAYDDGGLCPIGAWDAFCSTKAAYEAEWDLLLAQSNNEGLIDPQFLPLLLDYIPETGRLYWRARPSRSFGNAGSYHSWTNKLAGKEAFLGRCSLGYLASHIFNRAYRAHRVVWAMHYGTWPNNVIDHINGVTDDNRIGNLRDVSIAENIKNSRLSVANKTGFQGIEKRGDSWRAYISSNKKRYSLGSFASKSDAIAARKAAEARFGFHPNHGRIGQ